LIAEQWRIFENAAGDARASEAEERRANRDSSMEEGGA
jgi:hypothetical protein